MGLSKVALAGRVKIGHICELQQPWPSQTASSSPGSLGVSTDVGFRSELSRIFQTVNNRMHKHYYD